MPLVSSGSFWAENNQQYLNVQDFESGNMLLGINIYAFDDDGTLQLYLHADHAEIMPDGTWALTGVRRTRLVASQFVTDQLPSLPWHSFITERQVKLLTLPPETMPPVALYGYIRHLEQLQSAGDPL